jgi:Winged helix DNA-binding domain
MSFGPPRDGQHTFQRLDTNPRWHGFPDLDALDAALPSEAVRFLPGHDQWVMGPGTKDVHVTPSSTREPITRKANPVIVGGVVCGTWARKGDELTVTWLDERQRPEKPIEQEAARLAGIVGRDLHVRFTS